MKKCLFIFCCCFSQAIFGQDPAVKHFSVKDGLPSATIYGSIKDTDGFLWFGTDAGVSRFDGKKFTTFTLADGISDNEVLNIYQDSKRRIWFLGFNGTASYYLDGKFYNLFNDSLCKKITSSFSLYSMFEDKDGNLYFVTGIEYIIVRNDQIQRIYCPSENLPAEGIFLNTDQANEVICVTTAEPGGSMFLLDNTSSHKITSRYSRKMKNGRGYTHNGELLFRAKEGIVLQKDSTQVLKLSLPAIFDKTSQYGILLTQKDQLWITTTGDGIYCFDYQNLEKKPSHFLKGVNAASIIEDHENNIWVGTLGDGIYMLPQWHQKIKNYTTANGLSSNQISAVTKDENGNIFAGLNASELYKITKSSVSKVNYQTPGLSYNRITNLLSNKYGLWVGTDNGLILKPRMTDSYKKIAVESQGIWDYRLPVKDFVELESSLFIISSYTMFSLKLDDSSFSSASYMKNINLNPKRLFGIKADSRRRLWYGTSMGLFSYENGIEKNHSGEHSLLSKRINDIVETKDNSLILATYGYGILVYKNGKVKQQITSQNGLCSDICRKIFIRNDSIYVATAAGLNRLIYKNGRIGAVSSFTTSNGLASNDVNDVYVDDKDICIATSNGLTVVRTSELTVLQKKAPPFFFTEIFQSGKRLNPDSSYNFSYQENKLKIDFIALSYQLPERVVYQYRISPGDSWTQTTNTSVEFASLAAEQYDFQIKARIADGPWSAIRHFVFVIKQPFWRTTWFTLLCIFGITGIATLIFFLRLNTIKKGRLKKLQLQQQITTLEQQALQAMMKPHFIFNVMNSIQHYITSNDKHAASIYLSEFARLIRINLEISAKSLIPLDEEIEYLKLYLYLEKLRFEEKMTYDIFVDEQLDTDEIMIPVMILQPYIENAIWHGILPNKKEGHVQLNFIKETETLIKIEIKDNGVGIGAGSNAKKEGHNSLGLNLINQRLNLLGKIHGLELSVKTTEAYPHREMTGTKVVILLPSDLFATIP